MNNRKYKLSETNPEGFYQILGPPRFKNSTHDPVEYVQSFNSFQDGLTSLIMIFNNEKNGEDREDFKTYQNILELLEEIGELFFIKKPPCIQKSDDFFKVLAEMMDQTAQFETELKFRICWYENKLVGPVCFHSESNVALYLDVETRFVPRSYEEAVKIVNREMLENFSFEVRAKFLKEIEDAFKEISTLCQI